MPSSVAASHCGWETVDVPSGIAVVLLAVVKPPVLSLLPCARTCRAACRIVPSGHGLETRGGCARQPAIPAWQARPRGRGRNPPPPRSSTPVRRARARAATKETRPNTGGGAGHLAGTARAGGWGAAAKAATRQLVLATQSVRNDCPRNSASRESAAPETP